MAEAVVEVATGEKDKKDANYGWINGLKGDMDHLLMHIRGIPHRF